MEKLLNYIDGKLVQPIKGDYFENIEPAKGEAYSLIPDSDESDVNLAVAAAKRAFPIWSKMSAQRRSAILVRIANLITENLDELAQAESRDNGKPLKLARSIDIPRASSNFHFYGTAILHYASESHSMEDLALNYTLRQPIGVAGCISPWNLPLYLFSWKIAPALAAGNTVVAKPSEVTPYTAYLLSRICIEAGLPDGVLNIVHGYGPKAGASIIEHEDVPMISFTGGTATGEWIARTAAPKFKKLSLELGGKNPNIIFADCDFDDMMDTTLRSSFSNQGQICLCGSRILIERSIYNKFKTEFVKRVSKLKVGDPNDSKTNLGAVVSESHMEKVLEYVELAKEEGGTVLTGGHRVELEGEFAKGYFLAPTVIEGLPHTCRTNQEEIFGPVVTLIPFDTEEEAITMANSTKYGLASSTWTSDLKRAHRVARELHTGIAWINCWLLRDLRTPFGGVKNSGVGREGGFEALQFFTEPKNVCIKY
ncbi:MAG: aldehyde dehydrogenase [Flavobacteriales bacterium]|jgi:aminomuconate-semialdehyde/2-hydroxymuconate-6-semialdehyde dehydrogenase|nr:aldehyde dehydrogenase [Flavobacteriales bacterium]MBT3963529.1 aldehyde dehydrogenase [Flavobacteriales bacterium]MBT4706253.1 aldehyde dehydrogenase [Flavobacteriales bacterium]MBT4931428.1 aldehyde dehydrogenase [Flavobacteriales bacterium]MBT5131540.1 aldehyde dehydrogenase [Flavobacteriales bacterium]